MYYTLYSIQYTLYIMCLYVIILHIYTEITFSELSIQDESSVQQCFSNACQQQARGNYLECSFFKSALVVYRVYSIKTRLEVLFGVATIVDTRTTAA